MKTVRWLLLLYALPVRRNSERVSLWRKLKKFGAVALRTSGYVLPADPAQLERLQRLARQIRGAGGEATLVRVAEIDGVSNAEIVGMFNQARGAEYNELAGECREALRQHRAGADGALAAAAESLQRRFREIRAVDYFNSPGAHAARIMLQRLEKALARQPSEAPAPSGRPKWRTRRRPFANEV